MPKNTNIDLFYPLNKAFLDLLFMAFNPKVTFLAIQALPYSAVKGTSSDIAKSIMISLKSQLPFMQKQSNFVLCWVSIS